jgi:hypothetical protein
MECTSSLSGSAPRCGRPAGVTPARAAGSPGHEVVSFCAHEVSAKPPPIGESLPRHSCALRSARSGQAAAFASPISRPPSPLPQDRWPHDQRRWREQRRPKTAGGCGGCLSCTALLDGPRCGQGYGRVDLTEERAEGREAVHLKAVHRMSGVSGYPCALQLRVPGAPPLQG